MEQSKFLSVALDAARKSEDIIMKYFSEGFEVRIKEDMSPVTQADTEGEEVIKKVISSAFPDHGFIGEEHGTERSDSDYQWIIDPIDGTKNFARGIPLFGTQIALMHKGELVLGVSNAPALKELMYAEKGKGAFLNGKKVGVSSVDKLSDAYICYGNLPRFETIKKMGALLGLIEKTQQPRGIGDFWCYHLLASGRIDIMIEATTALWDIAAATIIIEEAGGTVTDITGKPVDKDTTSIIAANGLHAEVLKYFK
ncbi:MAG: inositol-phosphate phosphatase [Nanoarchaeota archaeon]|nr:inositol-phosphate phosphatase [Nanoarchaeota archaeon]